MGEETRPWEDGKMLVFDTSFIHSTRNNSESDRYVLMVRFWHPGTSTLEREALQHIFDILEDPEDAENRLKKRRKASKNPKAAAPSRGFG